MKTQVIILAGGKGTRMKASVNKTLLLISGIPVIIRSINAFIPYADSIVIAAPPDEQPIIRRLLEQYDISFPVQFADGGLCHDLPLAQVGEGEGPGPVHQCGGRGDAQERRESAVAGTHKQNP